MADLARWAWPLLLGTAAGACLVVQATLNATLRSALSSWAWAGLVSYVGGTASMLLILAARREQWPATFAGASWPSVAWTGGCFGALYLVLAIVLLPRLGAASLVACVVTGQMVASVAFDHFGWLGVPQHPVSLSRLLGAVLLIGAVILMKN
ncbi:MAG TPA: DMT family transporter [Polyangiaceae bacterium]|nr:DMT family transporter [Polyangiaceae bacterium]